MSLSFFWYLATRGNVHDLGTTAGARAVDCGYLPSAALPS